MKIVKLVIGFILILAWAIASFVTLYNGLELILYGAHRLVGILFILIGCFGFCVLGFVAGWAIDNIGNTL